MMSDIDALVESMNELSADDKNDLIRSIVCKIEMMKANRNQKHDNIGAMAGGTVVEYLIQYIQDQVIMQFDVEAAASETGTVMIDEEETLDEAIESALEEDTAGDDAAETGDDTDSDQSQEDESDDVEEPEQRPASNGISSIQ